MSGVSDLMTAVLVSAIVSGFSGIVQIIVSVIMARRIAKETVKTVVQEAL